MTRYDDFIASIKTQNTQKVVKSLSDIGKYDYSNCTMIDIEQVILSMKPNSPKAITTICYVMTLYAAYLQNNNMLQMVKSIDRTSLWARAKPIASQKFISHSDYQNMYQDIEKYEIYNTSYYKALLGSIYEGIYNNDLSVIKNLRYSDCSPDNVIALHDDNGATYNLEVSKDLIELLEELSLTHTWERNTRYGSSAEINIMGKYEDSCFKVENRGGSEKVFRYAYYRMLRKLFVEHLGCDITPMALYISGIMYRIKCRLNEKGITLSEAFKKDNRNKTVSSIIDNELKRSHYYVPIRNFREIVSGHLEIFEK